MNIWALLCIIALTSSDQILSRKKRIDEVNEDYDDKARNFDEHKTQETHDKIHEQAVLESEKIAKEHHEKLHQQHIRDYHEQLSENIESETNHEETEVLETYTESISHQVELRDVEQATSENQEDVFKGIDEISSEDFDNDESEEEEEELEVPVQSSMVDNAIKYQNRHSHLSSTHELTEEQKLVRLYNSKYRGVTKTQYPNGIDHLEPVELAEPPADNEEPEHSCSEVWIMNGNIMKTKCTSSWRQDRRPWCSLDNIFQGRYVFCPESLEEKNIRERDLVARSLFDEGVRMTNGWDTRKALVKSGYDKVVESFESGYSVGSGYIAFFKLMGYFVPLNVKEAKAMVEVGAAEGQAVDQDVMAFMYALGVGYQANQAKALLNWSFGALGGSVLANMALGYRYLKGITVQPNCRKALEHYSLVARVVMDDLTYGGGQVKVMHPLDSLHEENTDESGTMDQDRVNFLEMVSNQGHAKSTVELAEMHLGRAYESDYRKAADLLRSVADQNSMAAARLGRLYIDGRGVQKDYIVAHKWLLKAKNEQHPMGLTYYGILYQDGLIVDRTPQTEIFKIFEEASRSGYSEAQYRVGYSYLKGYGTKIDIGKAVNYLQLAAQNWNIRAIFVLAELHAEGTRLPGSCDVAVDLFKKVSERGNWARFFMQAANQYKNQKYQSAYMIYSVLAEIGYPIAQANVAQLLENHQISINGEAAVYPRALMNLRRAAEQGNFNARLKVGDYIYYGLGVDADPKKAAHHYRIAAEIGGNGQAFFNLGWMHQTGVGLEKDFPLAKRYYDHAMQTNPDDAFIPCSLAIMSLMTEDYKSLIRNLFTGVTFDYFLTKISHLIEIYVGAEWDLYLGCVLLFILSFVVAFRRQ